MRAMKASRSRSCGGCMSGIGKNTGRMPLAPANVPSSEIPRAANSDASNRETRQSVRNTVRSRTMSIPKSRNQPFATSCLPGASVSPMSPTNPCTARGRKSTRIGSVSEVRITMVPPQEPGMATSSPRRCARSPRTVPNRAHGGISNPQPTKYQWLRDFPYINGHLSLPVSHKCTPEHPGTATKRLMRTSTPVRGSTISFAAN